MSETIRLFVGTSPNGEDYEAEAVLAYSAQKHSSLPVEIVWMRQAKTGVYAGWSCASGRTPFSHFRWSLPAACDFSGRAIYCDADFIFIGDLAELWAQPIDGVILAQKSKKPGGKIKTCCMVFDCAKAKGHVPDLKGLRNMADPQGTLTKYFQEHGDLASGYGCGEWNSRDPQSLDDPAIKAVHYTRMEHQLHLKHAQARLAKQGKSHWYTGPVFPHPNAGLQRLFDDLLVDAQAAGYTYESFGYGGGVELVRRNFTYSTHRGGVPA